ncbi:MAG: alpha/beta fold hydrolase [Chloroflexi bacterium]|nr:alpha/beta fold hydrolase [Chloroflexota bacterium]
MPYAESAGARLYYEVVGAGPPLLLICGYGSNIEVYWANRPALAERFRVIAADPRGSGRSDAPEGAYTMRQFADDAVAVLDAAGVQGAADVLGTSFGGMVAQHVALEHPDRVRRLILGCTTPGGPAHVLPPPEDLALFMAAGYMTDPVAALRSIYPVNYSDTYAAAHDAELVARATKNAALRAPAHGLAGQSAAVQGHDTLSRLREIRQPTLVAHGAEDRVVPVENGRTLAANIPNARLVVYPKARHIFFAECADELNGEILHFLTSDNAAVAAK